MLIIGTVEEAPAEVASAAAKYLEEKRALGAIREKMNASLDALIAAMHEAGCEEILIDEGAKKLILAATAKGVRMDLPYRKISESYRLASGEVFRVEEE